MKKFFTWTILIIVFISIVSLGLYLLVGFYLSPQDKPIKSDVIVVVSGGQTTSRAEKGIDLFEQGFAGKIIFSGAALDDGPSNAFNMRDQALASGISPNSIYIDEKSQNTYENAINTKKIVDELGAKNIILVTSPYHQRRANKTFENTYGENYTITGVSAIDDRWSKQNWWNKGFPLFISLSELWKLFYINLTGNYK